MPHRREVQHEHYISFRICEVLFDLRCPVELRQRAGEIRGLRIATFAPYCMPNKHGNVGQGNPLVTKEQARVVAIKEGSIGHSWIGDIGHGNATNKKVLTI